MTKEDAKKKVTRKKVSSESQITTMGIYKKDDSWYFTEIVTQGDKVVKRDEHDVKRRGYAFDELKSRSIKLFMRDNV